MTCAHETSSVVRWLVGFLVGAAMSAVGGLGMTALRHEGQIGAWGARIDEVEHILQRVEHKLDKTLEKKP